MVMKRTLALGTLALVAYRFFKGQKEQKRSAARSSSRRSTRRAPSRAKRTTKSKSR